MQLEEVRRLLAHTPLMLRAHPAVHAYLPSKVEVLPTAEALITRLDAPEPCEAMPLLTFDTDPAAAVRLPLVSCPFDPYTERLNEVLTERYDTVAACTLTQREIANTIVNESMDAEIVVLLLVDGLSYRDVREWPERLPHAAHLRPCLVEGPTLTRFCFPAIIGKPPLAARLFRRDFTARVGFSYWHRENNALTNRLFATMHDVRRCRTMAQVIAELAEYLSHHEGRVYVQIVRMGLDAGAHHTKELPPVAALLDQLLESVQALLHLMAQTGRPVRLYLTADHGILWRDEFVPEVMGNVQGNPRMARWREAGPNVSRAVRFEREGETYFVWPYPLVRRPLRFDEAGMHGGLSFQESLVPFLSVEVNE